MIGSHGSSPDEHQFGGPMDRWLLGTPHGADADPTGPVWSCATCIAIHWSIDGMVIASGALVAVACSAPAR
jgi:hypothetical protein